MLAHVSNGAGVASTASTKYLIVNADDFGQSYGVNRGIIKAYCRGIVTSASLMVRWPGATEASAYARAHPSLSLGLHVDLGEKVFRQGEWVPVYGVVPLQDMTAIRAEITHQLEVFYRLMGHDPSHLDSHQHVHLPGTGPHHSHRDGPAAGTSTPTMFNGDWLSRWLLWADC